MAIGDIEISDDGDDTVRFDARYQRALLILRRGGRPVGRAEVQLVEGGVPSQTLAQVLENAQAGAANLHDANDRGATPSATVVVCTRDRADSAIDTVDSFERLDYDGELEIIVVDNAPRDDALQRALERRSRLSDRPVRRVVEPIPGLSRARNRALLQASGEIVAFTDDDATAEPQWLRMLALGFASAPGVGAVTGLTLPTEIETRAQDWAERFDGLNGGRGYERLVFHSSALGDRHPLYPFPTLGAGVNMAFRRSILRDMGGFCPALGVGTGTGGGEDTAALAEVLLRGMSIVYEPGALVRHTHRRDEEGLRRQMEGYGIGVAAYLTWCLHKHPARSLGMVSMAGHAMRYVLSRGASHQPLDRQPVPEFLKADLRRGLAKGPLAYLRAVRADRRQRQATAIVDSAQTAGSADGPAAPRAPTRH